MSLRTAIRRATERRRTVRGFTPVDQVLRTQQRPLVQHVHHRHQNLTSTTLRLQVSVPVQVVSTTHPIRVHVVATRAAATPVHPSTAYPGVMLRTPTPVAAGPATHPAAAAAAQVDGRGPRAAQALSRPPQAARPGPARIDLVHRQPTSSAVRPAAGSSGEWAAGARANAADQRAAWGPAAPGTPAAPGAAPLTHADVPRVVDHVVRELDRRLVASRERRGWTT